MNCPFYAQSIFNWQTRGHWQLYPLEGSNRCGLIMSAHSPCRMELAGKEPQWSECPRNPEVNEKDRS